MERLWLNHLLTDDERREFEERGYFVLPDVLPEEWIVRLAAATERVEREEQAREGLDEFSRLSVRDFIGRDEAFLELVDWPLTFPKVWGILGWNIQVYHSHLVVTPPEPEGSGKRDLKLNW